MSWSDSQQVNGGSKMWLFTRIGCFSAVQKPGTDFLAIRARAKGDIDALRSRYLPELLPRWAMPGRT